MFAAVQFVQGYITGKQFRFLFMMFLVVSAGLVFLAVIVLTYAGYVAPWSGRFYSLYDTGYVMLFTSGLSVTMFKSLFEHVNSSQVHITQPFKLRVGNFVYCYFCSYCYVCCEAIFLALLGMPRSTFQS